MSVEIIAEVASNHGGCLDTAKRFIDTFAQAGADTIKFQLTRVKHLSPADPQYEWFKRAELSLDQFAELKRHTEEHGKNFLITCYNADDMPDIEVLGCRRVKIGSGEAGNERLAQAVTQAITRHVLEQPLVSLGLGDSDRCRSLWGPRARFLACCTQYPAPTGLAGVLLERRVVGGWSDHSIGLSECQTAIVLGAQIIECHVRMPGQKRLGQVWEKTEADIRELRAFADTDPVAKYRDRWQFA